MGPGFGLFLFALILCLPFILLSAVIILIWRLLISIHFKVVHQNKYTLVSPADATLSPETYANTMTLYAFLCFKGQTDIEKLRERVLTNIMGCQKEDGRQIYQKLTWKLVPKYGFFAWETNDDLFDIRDHVKICPGTSLNRVYTEQEVFEAVEKMLDYPLDSKRPRWEILYVPKVRIGMGDDDLHFIVIIRAHHAYMDGLSLLNFFNNVLWDKPAKLIMDPVNPPMPKPSAIQLIGLYALAVFMCPYIFYKSLSINSPNVFQNLKVNVGPKFLGCTSTPVNIASLKLIRNKFKCSTTVIFNSVITGALRKAVERKGLPIPEEIDCGFTLAVLPYPNNGLQNRFTLKKLQSPISVSDPVKRLSKLKAMTKPVQYHEILALYGITGIAVGFLPRALIIKMYSLLNCAYELSNLPGFTEIPRMLDGNLEKLYGFPPINNGVGFSVGICSYGNLMQLCWIVEKSPIISCREEMNQLIADCEEEFAHLEGLANAKVQ